LFEDLVRELPVGEGAGQLQRSDHPGDHVGDEVVLGIEVGVEGADRIRRVVAVNAYDYAGGIARSSLLARLIVTGDSSPTPSSPRSRGPATSSRWNALTCWPTC
jgi:hypothetical protein